MFKRLIAMIVAFVCTIAGFIPVFAAEPDSAEGTGSITITGSKPGQTYNAYQIFTGQPDDSGQHLILDNIEWGSSINTSALDGTAYFSSIDSKDTAGFYNTQESARAVAELYATQGTDEETAQKMANALWAHNVIDINKPTGSVTIPDNQGTPDTDESYTITGLAPGYYMVTDSLDKTTDAKSVSAVLMEVVNGQVRVTPKKGAPTLTKQVVANTASTYTLNGSNLKNVTLTNAADYSLGDKFEYQLTITVPAEVLDYPNPYEMILDDTIDSGLSLDWNTIKVEAETANDKNGNIVLYSQNVNTGMAYPTNSGGGKLNIEFPNVQKIIQNVSSHNNSSTSGAETQNFPMKLAITYTCTLEDNAKTYQGSINDSNDNTAKLTYSNSPASPDSKGSTVDHIVKVYTAQLGIIKTDENNNALAGAQFTLYQQVEKDGKSEWVPVGAPQTTEENNEKQAVCTFTGLGSGNYKIEETKTPDGYNTADPITFTLTVNYPVNSANMVNGKPNLEISNCDHIKVCKDGTLSVTIQNQKGLHLPKTGSIGLAVIIVLGAGAVVLGLMMNRKSKTAK